MKSNFQLQLYAAAEEGEFSLGAFCTEDGGFVLCFSLNFGSLMGCLCCGWLVVIKVYAFSECLGNINVCLKHLVF